MSESIKDVILRAVGKTVLSIARTTGEMIFFFGRTLAAVPRTPFYVKETIAQMRIIGAQSLVLTSIVCFAAGLVLAMQTLGTLKRFGVVNYVATVVGLTLTRELGPVFTALMVAGRAGSGIAAELGSMKVTRQIDALRVNAVNPLSYLVFTRVVACIIVLPMLTIISDTVGILGGMLVAESQGGVTPALFLNTMLQYVGFSDVIPGLLKTLVFGLLIGVVACYQGFHTEGGTEGVGRATTTTVVVSSLTIMLSDVLLTRVLLSIFGE